MKFRAFYELPQISVYMYIFLVGSTTGFSVVANGAIIGVTHLKTSSYTHAWTHTHTHAHTDTHTHTRTHARTDTQTHTDTDILQFKVSRTPVLQMDEGELFCCWLPYKLSEGLILR